MNIAFFITPKLDVAFLYDDCSLRQGLEKMRHRGYTAIPVISREGLYIGTISEGDFLWHLLDHCGHGIEGIDIHDTEDIPIRDLLREEKYPPVPVTATVEQLVSKGMSQNFVPVIDDTGVFIGIVTRKDIIKHLAKNQEKK
ncbi:MAG: CBS domain-containing protein [Bacillota bacterium]|nr:CBS domain-containing protein [Bacillota bacterium]